MRKDTRIVYGANCTWWDDIHKVGKRELGGIPCCPHCRGMLYEMASSEEWWDSVDKHERDGRPGYREYVEWQRGKCFPAGHKAALAAYHRRKLQ